MIIKEQAETLISLISALVEEEKILTSSKYFENPGVVFKHDNKVTDARNTLCSYINSLTEKSMTLTLKEELERYTRLVRYTEECNCTEDISNREWRAAKHEEAEALEKLYKRLGIE